MIMIGYPFSVDPYSRIRKDEALESNMYVCYLIIADTGQCFTSNDSCDKFHRISDLSLR